MDKKYLLKELNKLSPTINSDFEEAHIKADELLLEYINDKEIKEAFYNVDRCYS